MILTNLIYIHPGHEDDFLAYEAAVLPLVTRHGGELLLRFRPDASCTIAGSLELPYEVHLVRFDSDEAFARYCADDERQRHLHLKDASVRLVWLIRGERIA